MTVDQIEQTITDLKDSITKIEPFLNLDDFKYYCGHTYTIIATGQMILDKKYAELVKIIIANMRYNRDNKE